MVKSKAKRASCMKRQYDFSKGKRGKFYRRKVRFKLPRTAPGKVAKQDLRKIAEEEREMATVES